MIRPSEARSLLLFWPVYRQIGHGMATLQRIRCDWTGFIGQPGVSTFYATAASTLLPQLETFFTAIAGQLPNVVRIQIEGSGDEIDSTTGALTGGWSASTPAVVAGSVAGVYTAVGGALAQWGTPTVLSGRRLKGHTFIVPIAALAYDASGQIASPNLGTLRAAAAALVTAAAGNMVLFQRPRLAVPSWTDSHGRVHAAITARGGGYGSVDTGTFRAVVTELRSRRD
jgi:hypothetical protein